MKLRPANIVWDEQQPIAADYDDIYFSKDGIAETERVFLQPGDVVNKAKAKDVICVGELGFGTGLNFAVTAGRVLEHSSARLHFISFEKHPLQQQDWLRVCDFRAQQLPIYTELRQQPLAVLPGWHQRSFAAGRIVLSVYHGEVALGLTELCERQKNPVDVWYLDGFAPSKNPAMWTPSLYEQLADLATLDTRVATFTSAGHVRRGLQAVGFDMQRIDQQPFKRESLMGRFQAHGRARTPLPGNVVVHGAGIAGTSMARQFAEHGCKVQVYDPAGIATGASNIAAAIMHSRLLGSENPEAELRASAFHYAANHYHGVSGFDPTGVMQIQGPNLDQKKLQRISDSYGATDPIQQYWIKRLASDEATHALGIEVSGEALLFPTAGVVDTPVLCKNLLDHPNIEFLKARTEIDGDHLHIICTASAVRELPNCAHLEVVDVLGQLDWYASTAPIAALPIVGNGYLVPTATGCALGASYEHRPWAPEQATEHNYQLNQHLLGKATLQWQHAARGARSVASDRIPIIGSINGEHGEIWLATALSSMGTTAAPLAAAMVCAEILGWMSPTSAAVTHLTRPGRFAERQARRGVRHIQMDTPTA